MNCRIIMIINSKNKEFIVLFFIKSYISIIIYKNGHRIDETK